MKLPTVVLQNSGKVFCDTFPGSEGQKLVCFFTEEYAFALSKSPVLLRDLAKVPGSWEPRRLSVKDWASVAGNLALRHGIDHVAFMLGGSTWIIQDMETIFATGSPEGIRRWLVNFTAPLAEMLEEGDRIELVRMEGESIPPGTRGKVVEVRKVFGFVQVDVDWEGIESTLSLTVPPDQYKVDKAVDTVN